MQEVLRQQLAAAVAELQAVKISQASVSPECITPPTRKVFESPQGEEAPNASEPKTQRPLQLPPSAPLVGEKGADESAPGGSQRQAQALLPGSSCWPVV